MDSNEMQPGELNLHHYKFTFATEQVPERLKDVRFVFVAGCRRRAEAFANHLANHLSNAQQKLQCESIVEPHSRLALFKVGPALVGDHGMGSPSLLIALHEILLMCKFAKVLSKVAVIRFGTCGGVGVQPGTLCITNKCFDPLFNEYVELKICGKLVRRHCVMDHETCQLLSDVATKSCSPDEYGDYEARLGATVASNDFYEEQGRTSGAICEHTLQDEKRFLQEAHSKGVINIEMESNHLVAMCHKLNVTSGVVCVSLNNRFEADHLELTPNHLKVYQQRLFSVLLNYVKHMLNSQ